MTSNAAITNTRTRPLEPAYVTDPFVMVCAVLVFSVAMTFAYWSATAQLAQGVTAGGVMIVEDRRRSVQHLEGGIIQDLRISEGEKVKAGDLAMVISDANSAARLSQAQAQRLRHLAALDRYEAQMAQARDISFVQLRAEDPQGRDTRQLIRLNTAIFRDELAAQDGERDLIAARIERLNAEAGALDVLRRGKKREIATVREEQLVQNEALAQRIGNISRVNEIARTLAVLDTDLAHIDEEEHVIRQSIKEAELELLQIDLRFRADISAAWEETANALTAVTDELNALQDQQRRSRVIVPVNGVVIDLDFTSDEGVVAPGARLFDIVPSESTFQVEVRFQPKDRDDLAEDHPVNLRFGTLAPVNPPQIEGTLVTIAADATLDPATNHFYYLAKVDIAQSELEKLSAYKISSGIPVEVFFDKGTPRTPLSYFIEPIAEMLRLGMRS